MTFPRLTRLSSYAIRLYTMERIFFSPASLVVFCNFDNGLCFGWSQSREDVSDWKPKSGRTTWYSSGTGPSSDHTSGSGLLAFEIYSLTFSYIHFKKTFNNWFMRQRAYVEIRVARGAAESNSNPA